MATLATSTSPRSIAQLAAFVATQDPALFKRADALLSGFAEASLRQNNFAVAIAVLANRGNVARGVSGSSINLVGAGPGISTGDLQALCDAIYEKRPGFDKATSSAPIYKVFSGAFKGRSPATNNWRNTFDLQTGLGCDAPWSQIFLQSNAYLEEPRFHCAFRTSTGECTSTSGFGAGGAHCFMPAKHGVAPTASTKALAPPKLLSRGFDGGGKAYWCIEPTAAVLTMLLGASGKRVPLYPFLVAFYGGAARKVPAHVDATYLQKELQLSTNQFYALFDGDPVEPTNAAILLPSPTSSPGASPGPTPARLAQPRGTPYRRASPVSIRRLIYTEPDPDRRRELLEKANNGHIETLDALAIDLKSKGFACREQRGGYDLLASGPGRRILFEVKTWTPGNLAKQTRSGLAQLLEYEFRNRQALGPTELVLVFDRKPLGPSWMWEFLKDRGVLPAWLDGGVLSTFSKWASSLP